MFISVGVQYCFFVLIQDHDKPKILGTGLCMVTVGIALIIITNVINNNEREKIMNYLVRSFSYDRLSDYWPKN
jgi:hypothetical protein